MASKLPQSVYRTAKGAQIDMLKLINQNEMTIAVGNMSVNARGDKIGPGGKIIGKRDEIAGTGIPSQTGSKPVAEEAPVITPVAKSTKKDVKDMDPEGNE
jgi:hypothetical protein